MPPLNGIDYGIICLIAMSGFIGMVRGLIREVFSLVTWAVGVWLALNFAKSVVPYLEGIISLPSARLAAAFGIIFFAFLLIAGLVGLLLETLVEKTGLSGTDRLAGLLFGIARGVILVSVLLFLAAYTPFPEDPWWKQSKLIPPFQSLTLWLKDQIPEDLPTRLKSTIDTHHQE